MFFLSLILLLLLLHFTPSVCFCHTLNSTQELESIAKIDMFLLMFNIVKDVCLQFCASLCVFFLSFFLVLSLKRRIVKYKHLLSFRIFSIYLCGKFVCLKPKQKKAAKSKKTKDDDE